MKDLVDFAAKNKCVIAWSYYDSPEEFRFRSDDVNYIAFVPTGVHQPSWLDSSLFGACDVTEHKVEGGTVFIGMHA